MAENRMRLRRAFNPLSIAGVIECACRDRGAGHKQAEHSGKTLSSCARIG
jgi:hypothetical protein